MDRLVLPRLALAAGLACLAELSDAVSGVQAIAALLCMIVFPQPLRGHFFSFADNVLWDKTAEQIISRRARFSVEWNQIGRTLA